MERLAGARRQLLAAVSLFGGFAALVVYGIAASPRARDGSILFLDQRNLFDILARVSNVGILAIGMTLVVITGGIDLSVGSVLSLGTVVTAMLLLERGWHTGATLAVPCLALAAGAVAAALASFLVRTGRPAGRARLLGPAVAFLVAAGLAAVWGSRAAPAGLPLLPLLVGVLAVGLVVGSLNGALVAGGGMQPFIATLATMVSVWGLAWLVTGESNARRHISTGRGAPEEFGWLDARLLGDTVPVPGLIFLGVAIAAHALLRCSPLGRRIYAIGGNEEAARLAGIPVAGTKILVYGLSGLLSALTGALWAAQYHQGFPDAGQGKEQEAIAAVVIGGTSLMGGRGGIPGTVMGVLMFGVLNNVLTLLQYTTNWQRLVTGAIIAIAVVLQQDRLRAAAGRFWAKARGG